MRDQEREETHVRYAFMIFKKFHEINHRGKEKTWPDFINSKFYNDFVKVGRYIRDINAINAIQFVDFLVRSGLPITKWIAPSVYETFVRELTKRESPDAAVQRNILLMQQWANDTGNHWTEFFRKINPAQATMWIMGGRISPWVLYLAPSAESLFNRFSEEQINIVSKYIEPEFWEVRMKSHQDEVEFLRQVFEDAGV